MIEMLVIGGPMAPQGTPLTQMLPATIPAPLQRISNVGVAFDMPRPNLLRNGGFEDWSNGPGPFNQPSQESADGWLVYPNRDGEVPIVIQEQPSTAPAGSLSCLRMVGSSTLANLVAQLIDPTICALNGVTVSLSVLVNAPLGSEVQAVLGILGDVGYQLPQRVQGTGNWQPLRMTCTLPDTAGSVVVALAGMGQFEFWFDNASLVVGSVPADYQPSSLVASGASVPGPAGPPGPRGNGWFSGNGPPPDPLPGSQPGDLYLDLETGDVWSVQAPTLRTQVQVVPANSVRAITSPPSIGALGAPRIRSLTAAAAPRSTP